MGSILGPYIITLENCLFLDMRCIDSYEERISVFQIYTFLGKVKVKQEPFSGPLEVAVSLPLLILISS